jgi:hypothetical protein
MGPEIPIVTGVEKVVFRQGKALRKNTEANGEDDFFANRKAPAFPCR